MNEAIELIIKGALSDAPQKDLDEYHEFVESMEAMVKRNKAAALLALAHMGNKYDES